MSGFDAKPGTGRICPRKGHNTQLAEDVEKDVEVEHNVVLRKHVAMISSVFLL